MNTELIGWGIAVAVLLLIIIRVRKHFFSASDRSHQNVPSVFANSDSSQAQSRVHQKDTSPTAPVLSGKVDVASNGTPPPLPEATAAPLPELQTVGAQNSTQPAGDPLTEQVVRAASLTAPSDKRLSSWNDRQLFTRFEGIVFEDPNVLPLPTPEELPIAEGDLVFGEATSAMAQLLPESQSRMEIQRRNLAGAGYNSRAAWINLNAIRFALAFGAMVFFGILLLMSPPALETLMAALVVIAPVMGWALPPLFVSAKANERRIDIERGIPDILDMLNMGVSQGLTVPAALQRIGPEIAPALPALAAEIQLVNRQAQVGSLAHGLRSFSKRIDSPEVLSFTSLLMQAEQTGTSIGRALTEYSDSMRSSLRERADSRANAASFKLLFPTVLCLMPSVFLFLLGPAILEMEQFFETTSGDLNSDREEALETLETGRPIVVPEDSAP